MGLERRIDGNLLLLRLDNPPANALSLPLRRQLMDALTVAASERGVAAVILYGAGRYFCAGAELRELGTEAANAEPRLSVDILRAIEGCAKPVIAALHGAAVGGGFELALACHYRVAAQDTRFALPELKHGIIPLSGSQRLPRAWGIERALRMMMECSVLTTADFAGSRVFDGIVPAGDSLAASMDFARSLAENSAGKALHLAHLLRNRPFADAEPLAALAAARACYDETCLTSIQTALLAAVRAGVESADFDAGLAAAQGIFDELSTALIERR
jgi:enoyl-CoA hydratase